MSLLIKGSFYHIKSIVPQMNVVSIIMWCISAVLLVIGVILAHKHVNGDCNGYKDIGSLAFGCLLFGGGFALFGFWAIPLSL